MPESLPIPEQRALIARAILSSSPVTRLALACPNEQLREQAANDLADEITERLGFAADQLPLAL